MPSYPGNSIDSARRQLSATESGNYAVTLTVHSNSYDGAILGVAHASFALAGAYPQDRQVTFTFPSPRIREGSRVCFILTVDGAAPGQLFYSVADPVGGCPQVIETEG